MATTDLIGAQTRTDHEGDTAPLPSTAALSPVAAAALVRLETAFLPSVVVRAVTRYETAALRFDELSARPASQLSSAELDAVRMAQETMTNEIAVLAEAGRADLLAPLEVATSYRYASAHCKALAEAADYDGWLVAQDEMGHFRCRLEQAGRLDLIGGA